MSIHPTAIIARGAEIDSSVEVGPFCVIDADVKVAAGCRLMQGVYLTGWTEIGEDCTLHPGVIVGHEPQDVKYGGERSFCKVGKRATIREYATIHRGTVPDSTTSVGDDCFLLAGSHVAHNCRVGNRVTMINNVLLAGHVEVADGTTIGGSAAVHQFTRIGELAMVAGCAAVKMDVVPFALTDEAGRISGINRVGLKRAGLGREEIDDIRAAYRVFFELGPEFTERLNNLEKVVRTQAGRRILEFVQEESKRGLAGRSKRSAR